jgi:hypothetical protein
MTILYLVLAVLAVSFIPLAVVALREWSRYRGTRVVTCPETKQPVAVHVDRGLAAKTAAFGEERLRLDSCTRWPEKRNCGQECLAQIEESPEGCLVRTMLMRWYDRAFCVLCRRPISPIHWGDNTPALLSPDGRTLEWKEIPPESLPRVLATHEPVCWSCHVARTFHERFPDLVIDLPPRQERRVS